VSERTVTVHKTAASMDPLTGIFNRRGFEEATARVIERGATAGRPVTVLIFDIDHFKSINDRGGRNRVEAAEELPLSLENWRRKTAATARRPLLQP